MPVMSIAEAVERYNSLVEFVRTVMKPGQDYGVIPGTDKTTLLKPGAEKLSTLFGFSPRFSVIESISDWTGKEHDGEPFFYYHYRCSLYRDEVLIADGEASCNSWEKKYRYRKADRVCPDCGKPTIFKGKKDPEWYCWAKKGGCGTTFTVNDPRIISQVTEPIPNPDIADQVNTIQKMSQKRAHIAATLVAVNASEFFAQDMEDITIEGEFTVVPTENGHATPPAKTTPAPNAPRETSAVRKQASVKGDAMPYLYGWFSIWAKDKPKYQTAEGQPDRAHLAYSLAALGFSTVDSTNMEQAITAMTAHAETADLTGGAA